MILAETVRRNMEKKELINQLARQLARDEINKTRKGLGLSPMKSLSSLWWRLHGDEFIERATKMIETKTDL